MTFCNIADIEQFLQITIPPELVGSASAALTEATATIRNYCGQMLSRVDHDIIDFDGVGGTRLHLPELPVINIVSIREDGKALVAGDDYKLGQHGIVHRVGATWSKGVQNIRVVYAHGIDPLPDDIMAICTRAASRRYQAGLAAASVGAVPGIAATSLGDYSVSFAGAGARPGESMLGASAALPLLRSEKEMLDKYRLK